METGAYVTAAAESTFGSDLSRARSLSWKRTRSSPILEALDICRDTAGNFVMETALGKVRDSISEGGTIAEPLGESGIFDDIVVNMIDVGEETGELDKMLLKVADTYDDEVDLAVASLVSILEPMLIVVMGGAVGLIVVSLFLPLLKIVETLGG